MTQKSFDKDKFCFFYGGGGKYVYLNVKNWVCFLRMLKMWPRSSIDFLIVNNGELLKGIFNLIRTCIHFATTWYDIEVALSLVKANKQKIQKNSNQILFDFGYASIYLAMSVS